MFKGMKRMFAMVLACALLLGVTGGQAGDGFALEANAKSWAAGPGYKKYEAPERTWQPLTDCEKYAASNEEAHFTDVKVGNWDTRSGKLEDSIRFCVANKKSYKNTHYIVYDLNGNYTQLSGLVSFCDKKSDAFTEAEIKIYLDNELAYESITLSDLSDDDDFTLDVKDVNYVRIVCSTTKKGSAYCVVAASVY